MTLEKIVSYCDKMYSTSDTKCENIQCEKCLDKIHFGDERRYNCMNMIFFYVCKYMYKYSSEIEHAFNAYRLLDDKDYLNILSIGCGPCTDLVGIKKATHNKNINLKYVGVDLNKKWRDIHCFIQNNNNSMKIKFIYKDIFKLLNKNESIDFNVLTLQYVLSDMVKYNNYQNMMRFIEELIDFVIIKMEKESLIIINDINYYNTRKYFTALLDRMNDKGLNYKYYELHFSHDSKSYYHYGDEYEANYITSTVPIDIQQKYNPWMFCSSAQLIIKKEE